MSSYAIGFSVFMIVFEIVIGLMLIIGARLKAAAWMFLLLIIFFTILTGFTFLTGYVPSGVNFFSFGSWGPYLKTNMQVTDCGCFGDFLKIEPKMSFMKDVVLLIPALILVFKSKDMHQLFSKQMRNILVGISTIALIWYCLSNFSWDLPHTDFRPFREGVNIRDQRAAELDAINNVEITAWLLKNNETGKYIELSNQVYMAEMANYPAPTWKVEEQIKSEPTINSSKLAEFYIMDHDGNDISDELLEEQDFRFWLISHKVPYDVDYENMTLLDTLYAIDTVLAENADAPVIVKSIDKINERKSSRPIYSFDKGYMADYTKALMPLIRETEVPYLFFLGGVDQQAMSALGSALDTPMPMYEVDEILLKTIIRSNPGLVLMKDGVVVKKWHHKNLPTIEELKFILGR
jgi:hypothetical protein